MAKVIGIGGLFFKTDDPLALREWYARVLGVQIGAQGVAFAPAAAAAQPGAQTVFSPFPNDTDYFEPSTREYMFNLMVDDLDGMLARCRREGVEPVRMFEDEPNGRFAHVLDLEGRKIELWQPKAAARYYDV